MSTQANINHLQAWMREFYGTSDKIEAKKLVEKELEGDVTYNGPEGLFKMSFPYYAPDASLPPLPTPEDVEKFRPPGKRPSQVGVASSTGYVYRINQVYAVKFSKGVTRMLLQVS